MSGTAVFYAPFLALLPDHFLIAIRLAQALWVAASRSWSAFSLSNSLITCAPGFSPPQARFDYEAFEGLLVPEGVVLFHNTARCDITKIYGPEQAYERRVKCFVDELTKEPNLQVFDLTLDQGVTLVRKCSAIKNESIPKSASSAGLSS